MATKDYVYDAEDRLVKVTVGTTHYKYKYDYLGRRIAKYTGSTLNKKFVYQGWNLIAELSSSGSVQRTFTWGLDVSTTLHGAGGVGGLLLIDDELTSKRYYPIYDGSRNITGLYDQDGALVASYEYDAFGRIILQSSGDYSDDNPFRFSTKYTDDETGLVYYGHRYYEPNLGRFINCDPIEEDGGLNLYGFVGNDPVNFYDYLGMDLGPPPTDYDSINEEADPRYPFTWASEYTRRMAPGYGMSIWGMDYPAPLFMIPLEGKCHLTPSTTTSMATNSAAIWPPIIWIMLKISRTCTP